MLFEVGLEIGSSEGSLAWVLNHSGCFAAGANGNEALANLPVAIKAYRAWLGKHDDRPSASAGEIEIRVVDTWVDYRVNEAFERVEQGGYEVSAWFLHDWKPLTGAEITRARQLLEWSRADLLFTVEGLSQEALEVKQPGERWNIKGILRHVGGAEWWYLDRLGLAFPQREVPRDPFERLGVVRTHLLEQLPELEGSSQVVGVDAELWSPRKLLRRTLWHERDHTAHIRKLI